MDKSPEMDTSDDLVIVNRSKTYHVSKKIICSSIPYFEKMFCCDLLESKENKVTLDLDEDAFQCILTFVFSDSYVLTMNNVLQMIQTADYLMSDKFQDEFLKYFQDNFTIEHLPQVLSSIDEFSKLVNLRMINYFIEKHFLKIINTSVFLDYPVATIDHMLKLNLHIDSEFQVFTAITKWIKKDQESRKIQILQLLKCIRWCHLKRSEIDQIEKNELMRTLIDPDLVVCSPDACKSDCGQFRDRSKLMICISKVDQENIDILIIDGTDSCLPCGRFKQDTNLSTNLISSDEFISDIIYDSGRKGIRVDWRQSKFRYLDIIGPDNSYYGQIHRYIMRFNLPARSKNLYLIEEEFKMEQDSESFAKNTLLEFDGRFHVCGYSNNTRKLFVSSPVNDRLRFYGSFNEQIHSCLIGNAVFIITKDGVHRSYNLDTSTSTSCDLMIDQKFKFDDLQLMSLGSKFYLLEKSSKTIYAFDEKGRKWEKSGQIRCPHELITLTTIYLPDKENKTSFKPL